MKEIGREACRAGQGSSSMFPPQTKETLYCEGHRPGGNISLSLQLCLKPTHVLRDEIAREAQPLQRSHAVVQRIRLGLLNWMGFRSDCRRLRGGERAGRTWSPPYVASGPVSLPERPADRRRRIHQLSVVDWPEIGISVVPEESNKWQWSAPPPFPSSWTASCRGRTRPLLCRP